MTADDFRRIALSLEGVEEGEHFGAIDFRVGGRIFATLAHERQGYGNLMLTPELQGDFIAGRPDLFLPVHGGWGRNGATHIRLEEADEGTLAGALRTAWKLRSEKNAGKKAASKAAPKPAPKAAPQALPKASPKPAPKPASKAASQAGGKPTSRPG